jgi:peptide/nickel transport system permease protein
MPRYIVQRLLVSIPVFFGVTVIVYGLWALAPGDPVANIIGMEAFEQLKIDEIEAIRHQYGFDKPWIVRYVSWLGRALQGDLGYPLKGNKTVADWITDRVGPTVLLMGTSLFLALIIGIPMGIVMALKQYSRIDYIFTVVAFVNLSIPSFFVALAFMYIFALRLGVLPTYGMATIGVPFSIVDRLRHLIMPSIILGVFHAGTWARYTRASVLEVMRMDYVTVARAKGLKERVVTVRHIFRNALLPLVTIVSLSIPSLLGGTVIIETIFQWPGMGMLGWRATTTRDYPMLMGLTLLSAVMILSSNLIADILYSVVDPRIHYD